MRIFSRTRWPIIALVLLMVLVGCGSGSGSGTGISHYGGWLYVNTFNFNGEGEAHYLVIVQNGQATLTDASYSLYYTSNANVRESECCGETTTTLKVIHADTSNNSIQLMYTGNTNYGQTVTGTFNADATTLTINGHMYIPATQEDFNKAVAALCQNAYANGHNQVGGVCFGPTSTAPAPTATPTPTIQATPTTAPKPVLICQQDSTGQQTFCHYQGEQPGPNAVCYDVNGNPIQGVVYVGSPATPCVIPGH